MYFHRFGDIQLLFRLAISIVVNSGVPNLLLAGDNKNIRPRKFEVSFWLFLCILVGILFDIHKI